MYTRTACFLLAASVGMGCSLVLSFDGISGGAGTDASSGDSSGAFDVGIESGGDDRVGDGADVGPGPTDDGPDAPALDDSAAPDVASDSFVRDAPTPSDTGPAAEAGDAGEGGLPAFCASLSPRPVFCDDFDEHPLPGVWDTLTQTGGTVTLDNAASVSPPKSLLAKDSALQPGQPLDSALRMHFSLPPPPTTFVWDFWIQPVAVDTGTTAAIVFASIDFTDGASNRYSVQFTLFQNGGPLGVRMEEQSGFADGGSSYTAHPLPDPLPIGKWTDLRLTLTRTAATSASARVTFDSAVEMDAPIGMTVNGSTLQMTIGSSYETEPSQGWTIRYDNVTLNF
jgi:hypothetical protein